ncbi:polysaccharide ABC transporter ATP-binding protein [Telluribacter sp.]|jgi:lipopolysaccharide transport system ATP-binding protein|uniref:ABC transporter ATP-binding protein n=1 Tax=Telluribacter sp. TaxID=1978767 RepID=UPI002E10DF48|nr:polysaccharide ABC transporter ATP-binding protein [Telluribacter sp.]
MSSSNIAIRVENVSKLYQLGEISTGTLTRDLHRWWARLRGQEDPFRKIGQTNDRTTKGESDFVWALEDINFEVQQGEVLGIIGRNGAGKSTLLKILSRVTKPTTGCIRVRGRIASLLEVGTGFHPELTGRENIFLNGAIMGMRKAEIRAKLDEIVDFAGVERYLDTPVKRYSSGMYVRLAFAVAAHLEPEILVVDEVLAVGDADFQKKCLGKMKDVSEREGRTVLFVSHDLNAISTLTDKSVLMESGKLFCLGPTTEVITTYLNNYATKELLYSAPAHSDRPSITDVRLETSLPNNHHGCLAPLFVNITLHTPFPLRGACLSFQIVNNRQQPIAHLWSFDSERPMCRETGTYQIQCEIPKSRLYIGDYSLKAYFTGPPGSEIFDIVENICPFKVEMIDLYREFPWRAGSCTYLEDAFWSINKL